MPWTAETPDLPVLIDREHRRGRALRHGQCADHGLDRRARSHRATDHHRVRNGRLSSSSRDAPPCRSSRRWSGGSSTASSPRTTRTRFGPGRCCRQPTRCRPAPNAGWPCTCCGSAPPTPPSATSSGGRAGARSTSPSTAAPCRCEARTRSARSSSTSTGSGKPPAARPTTTSNRVRTGGRALTVVVFVMEMVARRTTSVTKTGRAQFLSRDLVRQRTNLVTKA